MPFKDYSCRRVVGHVVGETVEVDEARRITFLVSSRQGHVGRFIIPSFSELCKYER